MDEPTNDKEDECDTASNYPEVQVSSVDIEAASFSGSGHIQDSLSTYHNIDNIPLTVLEMPSSFKSDMKNCEDRKDLPSRSSSSRRKVLRPMSSIPSYCCRFCQQGDSFEFLISPCHCRGTLAYIHLSCLRRWLNQVGRNYCELCLFRYNTIETRRYSLCRSLRLWIRHPRNWRTFKLNLIIIILLTVFVCLLVAIVMLGMGHFIYEGGRVGISSTWVSGVVSFFLAIIIFIYIMTSYFFIRDQLGPWYRWWHRCINVQIVFDGPIKIASKPVIRTTRSFNDLEQVSTMSRLPFFSSTMELR